jgi:flagellar hook assembly protein FlgD
MVRRRILVLAAAGAASLVWAASAWGRSDAGLTARELPPRGTAAARFDLLGLHWMGSGTLWFRTRSVAGRWSAWRAGDPADGGPTGRWHFSEPYWTGPSDRVQWRTTGRVSRVRAYYVVSRSVGVPGRQVESAGSPHIVPRRSWGADEGIVRAAPRYALALHFAVVHHTAGTNDYTPEESAAIVKGIELYHVKGNGWNDIGYNFLVDRYGQVFEGRGGGIAKNVVGAHAGGFNTGSVGVSVIGSYGKQPISSEARTAIVKLLAWRLDLAHVDPLGTVTWSSGGNEKYPAGTPVTLRAVSGHRDTGLTDCPGNALYAELPALARAVAATGLPKLYDPVVSGRLGGSIRFTGRLSSAQPWTIFVRNTGGVIVATGTGTGSAIDWTWNSTGASGTAYSWTMQGTPAVRPAKGTIGISPPSPPPPPTTLPPVMSEFSGSPGLISPDGDGVADALSITYRLRRAALVTAQVADATGLVVSTLFSQQRQSARVQSWDWSGGSVPDGRYTVTVRAVGADGVPVQAMAAVVLDRTLGFLTANPLAFSPNGDGRVDTITFGFDLGATATVTVSIVQYGRAVATVYTGALSPGPQQVTWNGQTPLGTAPDGQYDVVVSATDALATSTESLRFTVDSHAT